MKGKSSNNFSSSSCSKNVYEQIYESSRFAFAFFFFLAYTKLNNFLLLELHTMYLPHQSTIHYGQQKLKLCMLELLCMESTFPLFLSALNLLLK